MPDEEFKKILYELNESSKWMKESLEDIKKWISGCDDKYASKGMERRLNNLIWSVLGFIVLGILGYFFAPESIRGLVYLVKTIV